MDGKETTARPGGLTPPGLLDMPGKIATERLVLERPWPATPGLAEEIFSAVDRSRATLRLWLPWIDTTLRPEDELAYLAGPCVEAWENKRAFRYAIRLASTGGFAGFAALEAVSAMHRRGEVGYWLSDAHVGHGYMQEAVLALERAAFDAGFNRLVICNNTRNARSVRVATATGHRLEGVLRQERWDAVAERYVDTNVFSKLESDLQEKAP